MDNQDILHPLATLHWEKILYWGPIRERGLACEIIIYDGKVYTYDLLQYSLWCAPMTGLTSWTPLPLPHTDMEGFALTTYHSQLVLVGGWRGRKDLNEVWVSADGTNWQQSLPPMPTMSCHYGAVVVNTGSPECLVVASYSVDVLVQKKWSSFQSPFTVYRACGGTTHNGNLYLTNGRSVYYCQVESLLAACTQTGAVRETALWKKMSPPGGAIQALVSFGQQLLAITSTCDGKCAAFSPLTRFWVLVADTVDIDLVYSAPPISAREMLVSSPGGLHKATLRVSPYDPDSQFNTSALTRLEAAGIPVMTSLQDVRKKLAAAIGAGHLSSLDDILEWWVSGKTSPVPPTWKSLYDVLRELDLEELGQQIEDYLSSPRSLKEQCTSVIVSALLQQRPLEPDQLHVRLPDYVPPTVKRSLTRTLKVLTMMPSDSDLPPSKRPHMD